MDPILLPTLLSLAPGLLSSLFGGGKQKKYQKKRNQILSPQNLAALQQTFYKQALASPAYAQAQGTIATGANQAGGDIANSLAQRGLGTSGVGAILPGLISSMVGGQQAGLRTSAYQGASGQAQNAVQQQLASLQEDQGPSQTQNLFAGGLDAFLPILQQYLMKRPGLPQQSLQEAGNYPLIPRAQPRPNPALAYGR